MIPQPLTRDICRSFIEQHLLEPSLTGKTSEIQGDESFIGVELECFPYTIDPNKNKNIRPVLLNGGKGSLSNALTHASEPYGGIVKYLNHDFSKESNEPRIEIIGFPDGDRIQFEPGGQVELITAPCKSMEELNVHLTSKQDLLRLVTQNDNIHFGQFGTNPWFDVHEIGLQMNKPRFRSLGHYFDGINPYGKQMMLQTCSLHVNLDLGLDCTTRIKRIITANLLAPFATALFANSSIIEGKETGHKSYRSFLWNHLDAKRTGILPMDQISKTLNKEDFIDLYLEFALKAPLIYISDLGEQVFPGHYTLEYWLTHPIEGILPAISNLKNHLSLLFPEVRLKGYLEIRSVDAPPSQWQLVPAIFYAGLLYSDEHLDKTLAMLLPLAARLNILLEQASFAMASDEIFSISKNLMKLAIEGFSCLPDSFKKGSYADQLISFFEKYTLYRKTFADECIDKFLYDKSLVS